MKKEMALLEQMVEEGQVRDVDRWNMILAMDDSEWQEIWESKAEFDPRRFMAKDQESASQTMLDEIMRAEQARIRAGIEQYLRQLDAAEQGACVIELVSGASTQRPELANLSLLGTLAALRRATPFEAFQILGAIQSLEDFAECVVTQQFDAELSAQQLLQRSRRPEVVVESHTQLEARPGDVLMVCASGPIEILPAQGNTVTMHAWKHYQADTQEEAEAGAHGTEVWTFVDGHRIWVRSSLVYPYLNQGHVRLQLELPAGVGVNQVWDGKVAATDVEGEFAFCGDVQVDGLQGKLTAGTRSVGNIRLARVDGEVEAYAFNAPIQIEEARGDIQAQSILSPIHVCDSSGRYDLHSLEGDLVLEDVCTSKLVLRSKRGQIRFAGTVMPSSDYRLETESGDIEVALDSHSDCGLSAETTEGSVEWTLELGGTPSGPANRKYANIRAGSGGFDAVSKTGNILIRDKA